MYVYIYIYIYIYTHNMLYVVSAGVPPARASSASADDMISYNIIAYISKCSSNVGK